MEKKITKHDSRLLGKWNMQLSCDGSILCNVCAQILFKDDGMGVTTMSDESLMDNFKWEVKNDSIKIVNTYGSLFKDGQYSLTFDIGGDNVRLTLLDSKHCYQLIGTKETGWYLKQQIPQNSKK